MGKVKVVEVYKFEDMFEIINGSAVLKQTSVTYIIMNDINISKGEKLKSNK